ncbi:MAG: hypothetical protein WC921_02670 [Candidatus Paceibacterota bacterium]|jgi:hypothetical protein
MIQKIKYIALAFLVLLAVAAAGLFFLWQPPAAEEKEGQEITIPTPSSTVTDYPLTDKSVGSLSIQKNYPESSSSKAIFLFEYSEGTSAYDFPKSGEVENLFLASDNLYYLDGGEIKLTEIFTGEGKTVPIPYEKEKPVYSFIIKGDKVYYLSGSYCDGFSLECDIDLKSYDLKTGSIDNLASSSRSIYILGFSKDESKLYLEWSSGDAGCSWSNYESFTFSDRSLKSIGSWLYCEGGEKETKGESPNVDGLSETRYLFVKNGVILIPTVERYDGSDKVLIKFNSADYSQGDLEILFGGNFIVKEIGDKKTVENTSERLLMKVPKDWEIRNGSGKNSIDFYNQEYLDQPGLGRGGIEKGFKLSVFIEDKKTSLEEIKMEEDAVEVEDPSLSYKTEKVKVSGWDALKITVSEEPGPAIAVKVPAGDKLYIFIFYPSLSDVDGYIRYFDDFLGTVSIK